jgi:ABC-type phosphate transport system ATPase subunit
VVRDILGMLGKPSKKQTKDYVTGRFG